ncbi:uncharacterized protein [Dysidea avara]|uniref:uncharacterized protein n=1 Tax=Dysidea avara TaxID=196820 RepID=UPI00332F5491
MPSQTAVDTESDLSKHVAIMSGLCETEDRISKILRGYEEDCTPNVDYDDEYFTGQRRYSLRGCSFDSGSEGSSTRVLTSLRDSLKKQFNGFLTDDCVVEMEEPSMEEFVSTIDLTSNHLRKLDEINQTILKLARESKAVQPVQQDKAAASGPNDHQYNHLMKMYTDEAMKSSKLQKVVNDQGNELQQMKTGYSILSSKSKNENELYQQTLTSLTEANQVYICTR